jgi:hypothetical protein
MIRDAHALLARIRAIHADIRDSVVAACETMATEQLTTVVAEDEGGDTIFAIDRISEDVLLHAFHEIAQTWPCVLVAEGLGASGQVVLPEGNTVEQAEICVIVDPIDGTRGIMYQKRPAWILTGVAPFRGSLPTLADIEIAVQTEIPLVKQHLSDALWVVAGEGVGGERHNRITGESQPLHPAPSRERTIARGYGGLARFFPGMRAELAAIDDTVVEHLLGPVEPGQAQAFEDQYISSGGQLYELVMGHDRWIADLRPVVEPLLRARGLALGLCCHPYDLCTERIAREAGVVVTDERGAPLAAPLDVSSDVAWIGYANATIRQQVEPVLQATLRERGLWTEQGTGDVDS